MRSHGFATIEDKHERWWRNARVHRWWSWGSDRAESSVHIGAQLVHGPHRPLNTLRLKVSTTGEETLDVAYGLGPILRHYWDLDLTRRGRLLRLPGVRFELELGLTHVEWCFGQDDQSWHRDASLRERLRRNRLTFLRVGRRRRSVEVVATATADLPLPEGPSPVDLKLERSVWCVEVGPYSLTRRSRRRLRFWLPGFRRVLWHAEVSSAGGLPVPGKGENSWDCGPDAIYSSHFPVRRPFDPADREWIGEALATTLASILRDRTRHGAGIADTGR